MARAIGDGLYYLIVDVVVHSDYQKKGIGKLLSGIIGGTFGVVESITSTLYSATQSITGSTMMIM